MLPMCAIGVAVCSGALALSIGPGVHREFSSRIGSFGLDAIVILPNPLVRGSGNSAGLTLEDAKAIRSRVAGLRAVSPSLVKRDVTVRYGDRSAALTVEGFVDRGAQTGRGIEAYRLERGAMITQSEDDNLEQVAVIGPVAGEVLFPPGTDPVDELILIENQPFRVKGVLHYRSGMISRAREGMLGALEDMFNNQIFVPYKTASRLLFGSENLSGITVFV